MIHWLKLLSLAIATSFWIKLGKSLLDHIFRVFSCAKGKVGVATGGELDKVARAYATIFCASIGERAARVQSARRVRECCSFSCRRLSSCTVRLRRVFTSARWVHWQWVRSRMCTQEFRELNRERGILVAGSNWKRSDYINFGCPCMELHYRNALMT